MKGATMRYAPVPLDRDQWSIHDDLRDLYPPVRKRLVSGANEGGQRLPVARRLPAKMVLKGRSRETFQAVLAAAIPDFLDVTPNQLACV